jgi:hypothetical protein
MPSEDTLTPDPSPSQARARGEELRQFDGHDEAT